MDTTQCIQTRRSIRKYKPDPIDHTLLESIISTASYSPSWKNTQITRYIAIEDSSILKKIADDYTPSYNSNIVSQLSMLVAVTMVKGRSGFERDGSYSTKKETAGRCLTQELPVRVSVLQRMKPDLEQSSWEFLTKMASATFSTSLRSRSWQL